MGIAQSCPHILKAAEIKEEWNYLRRCRISQENKRTEEGSLENNNILELKEDNLARKTERNTRHKMKTRKTTTMKAKMEDTLRQEQMTNGNECTSGV